MGIQHQIRIGEKTSTRKFPKRDQFAAELIYFSNCILKGKEPEPSGLEGLADVRIVRAAYEKKRPTSQQEIHRPPHGKPKTVKVQSPSGD